MNKEIHIFMAFGDSYVQHASVAIASIIINTNACMHFHILHSDITDVSKAKIEALGGSENFRVEFIRVEKEIFKNFPTAHYISLDTWSRVLIPWLKPDLDRAIYLDADICVIEDIAGLWTENVDGVYAGVVSDAGRGMFKYVRSHADWFPTGNYFNAGVLLLNLKKLRADFTADTFLDVPKRHRLKFADQDALNMVIGTNVRFLPEKWNALPTFFWGQSPKTWADTGMVKRLALARKEPAIVHFSNIQKPWITPRGIEANPYAALYFEYLQKTPFAENGKDILNNAKAWKINIRYWWRHPLFFFRMKFWKMLKQRRAAGRSIKDRGPKKPLRIALLVDEYFGALGTAFGGYGFLARRYVAKYVPCRDIEVEVLLDRGKRRFHVEEHEVDGVTVFRIPRNHCLARHWLKRRKYDVYLSIEMTTPSAKIMRLAPRDSKLLLWIQDPRPKSKWDGEIGTMNMIKDPCFYDQQIPSLIQQLADEKRLVWLTQGRSLVPLAQELYETKEEPDARYLPNPIEIDFSYDIGSAPKKNSVVFLGRLEAQKRVWLVCETARHLPQYEFHIVGKFFRYETENRKTMQKYLDNPPPNLHFDGHLDGVAKQEILKTSKVLLTTSIWEGIPISWLEALSFGTLLVSNLDNEGLVSRFGICTGENPGDGFDGVPAYAAAIEKIMTDDAFRREKADAAVQYIRETHNVPRFIRDLRGIIQTSCNTK